MLLLLITFLAGVLTVLAPCILPLLPVVVGGSVSTAGDSRKRVFVIVASLGVSVIAFTLLLKATTALIGVPQFVWAWISASIIIAFGMTLLFPGLWERLPLLARLSADSNRLLGVGHRRGSVVGDMIIGAALGPVFTTCSPTYFIVLATVLPENFILGLLYLFSYTCGLCLMLLLVGLLGQSLADKLAIAANPNGLFKRGLGLVFIAVGVVVGTGFDKQIQISLLNAGIFDITRIEERLLRNLDQARATSPQVPRDESIIFDEAARIAQKESLYTKAPEINMPAGFVNTDGKPISIGEFKGKKVVLLDIWTYSCINCQRTIPYLVAWNDEYSDDGLQIIGIHTPEFSFEKDIDNVKWAVEQFGITYPTVLDNDYATWKALGNSYWPRKYLIDIDGYIVYDHAGEGAYEETEAAIQRALMERAMVLGENESVDTETLVASELGPVGKKSPFQSPEIYFGAFRNDRLGNGAPGLVGEGTFTVPDARRSNVLYLGGDWEVTDEYVRGMAGDEIVFKYTAAHVFFVASGKNARITVFRDGIPVGQFAGDDVEKATSSAEIRENRLYKLIQEQSAGAHELRIRIEEGTLDAYTLTFG